MDGLTSEQANKWMDEWVDGQKQHTVELQWFEFLWDHENMFETGVVQAKEC